MRSHRWSVPFRDPHGAYSLCVPERTAPAATAPDARGSTGPASSGVARPVPSPEAVAAYERILPGTFNRILQMAERAQEGQIATIQRLQEFQRRDTKRGHILGFIGLIVGMAGAAYCVALHQPYVAVAFLSVPVMAVAKALVDSAKKPAGQPLPSQPQPQPKGGDKPRRLKRDRPALAARDSHHSTRLRQDVEFARDGGIRTRDLLGDTAPLFQGRAVPSRNRGALSGLSYIATVSLHKHSHGLRLDLISFSSVAHVTNA